jgi:ankyrin repeat domain-containing protein 50
MDGISAAASAIAVVQISMQAFDLCRIYYLEAKEARDDIQRLRDEVTSLQDVLTNVADLAEDPSSAELLILNQLNQQDGPVQQCQRDLLGLVAKLETGRGKNPMKQFGLRALKWPFSNKDIEKLLMTIGRHKATFNLALTADHV